MEENNLNKIEIPETNQIELRPISQLEIDSYTHKESLITQRLTNYYIYGIPDENQPGARLYPNDTEFIKIMQGEPYNLVFSGDKWKKKAKLLREQREEARIQIANEIRNEIVKTNAIQYDKVFNEITNAAMRTITIAKRLEAQIENDPGATLKEKIANLNKNGNTMKQAGEMLYILSGEKQNINGNNNQILKNPTVNIIMNPVSQEALEMNEDDIIIIEEEPRE